MNLRTTVLHASVPFFVFGLLLSFFQLRKAFARQSVRSNIRRTSTISLSLPGMREAHSMTPDDKSRPVVKPVMTHFFYMDEDDPTKVRSWFGAVGPIQF
jgi:hypothetical protein